MSEVTEDAGAPTEAQIVAEVVEETRQVIKTETTTKRNKWNLTHMYIKYPEKWHIQM